MTREEVICILEDAKSNAAYLKDIEVLDMAIAALREQPRWISVEERLPEECGQYIVVMKYNHKRDEKEAVTDIDIATWGETASLVTGDRTFEWTSLLNDWDEGNGAEITHWIPSPESPKVEV